MILSSAGLYWRLLYKGYFITYLLFVFYRYLYNKPTKEFSTCVIYFINKSVNRLIENELVSLGLAKKDDIENTEKRDSVRMKYFMHGNSHFMGLDVHDVGLKDTKLMPGMVLSCEPGIYIADENIGIRLENDILVTKNGQVDWRRC